MLPNFLIVGALKSGTTSLFHYARDHPDIWMPLQKELHFFSVDDYWDRGLGWYESFFRDCTGEKAVGEASVSYMRYPEFPGVPERIHSVIPEARLICVLRNPIDRACSHYFDNFRSGLDRRTIEEALSEGRGKLPGGLRRPPMLKIPEEDPLSEISEYISFGMYWRQIQQYLRIFSAQQLLVITFEDMLREPSKTMRKVYSFVDVEPSFESPRLNQVFNKTSDSRIDRWWFRKIKWSPLFRYVYSYKLTSGTKVLLRKVKTALRNVISSEWEVMSVEPYRSIIRQRFGALIREDVTSLSEFLGRDLVEYWGL